jgi:hypothetical protein
MSLITSIHSAIRLSRVTGSGRSTVAPETVPEGTCKEYPRMPRIALPVPIPIDTSITDVISHRRSSNAIREFTISQGTAGTLFGTALRQNEILRRPYPSAGALYPIETYYFGQMEGFPSSVFHYHPKKHALPRWQCVYNFYGTLEDLQCKVWRFCVFACAARSGAHGTKHTACCNSFRT